MGMGRGKVNQSGPAKCDPKAPKLPFFGTHDTRLARKRDQMTDRDRKPPFRRGGKPFDKGRPSSRTAWRSRETTPDGPVILYGWHTVTMALANPKRRIRKLLLTENAARRLDEENIATRLEPEIVRPSQIDQLLSPDAVHQGLYMEADPLPAPDLSTLAPEGLVLVLDHITAPHNVAAILRSAAA